MQRRDVIAIGEAIHDVVEQALKRGTRMSGRKPRRTAAEEEALRLRTEAAQREQHKFGKKKAKALTDADPNYMGGDSQSNDPVPDQAQNPSVLMQMNQIGSSLTGRTIMEEIQSDRMNGKLRPFVEGEPIGKIQKHKRGPAKPLKTRNEIMDDRRNELRERQQQNDATLDRLLKGTV